MVSSLEMEKVGACERERERVRISIEEVLRFLPRGLGVCVLVIISGCMAFTPSGLQASGWGNQGWYILISE